MSLAALIPVYILVVLGFGVVKSGYIARDVIRPANVLVVKVFVPVLIFLAIFRITKAGNFDLVFMFGYAIASLGVFATVLVGLRFWGMDGAGASLLSLGAAGSNSIFIAFPIMLVTFPNIAETSLGWVLVVENLLIIPLALVLYDILSSRGRGGLGVIALIAKNPIVIALGLGVIFPFLVNDLWAPLEQALTLIKQATAGISLILVGAMLARSKLGGQFGRVVFVSSAKLVLHPLLTLGVFVALGVPHELVVIAVTFAAVSCFGVYANFCEMADQGQFGASVFFMTTAFAPITLFAWLVVVNNI